MSNPTLLAASLASSLAYTDRAGAGAFTGVDPIRYDSGLFLETGATSYAYNPVCVDGVSGRYDAGAATTRVTSLPGPLPDGLASRVTTGAKLTATGSIGPGSALASALTIANPVSGTYPVSAYVWVPTAMSATAMVVRPVNFTSGVSTDGAIDLSKRDQWQLVTSWIDEDPGDTDGHVGFYVTGGTMLTNEFIYVTGTSIQELSYPTTPIAGSMGSGYSYDTTPLYSPSTRAASSASVATANHLDPASGAIAFRITPTIETGVEEIWGEAGTKAAATDHVRWGRDSSKHPFVEWSANNAAYQRKTGSETLNTGTRYFGVLDWDGTAIGLQIDSGARQTGTRAAVSDSFGAGALKLEASAGGVVYRPFATFDRLLTVQEIAILRSQNNWVLGTVVGATARRIRQQFQLRAY